MNNPERKFLGGMATEAAMESQGRQSSGAWDFDYEEYGRPRAKQSKTCNEADAPKSERVKALMVPNPCDQVKIDSQFYAANKGPKLWVGGCSNRLAPSPILLSGDAEYERANHLRGLAEHFLNVTSCYDSRSSRNSFPVILRNASCFTQIEDQGSASSCYPRLLGIPRRPFSFQHLEIPSSQPVSPFGSPYPNFRAHRMVATQRSIMKSNGGSSGARILALPEDSLRLSAHQVLLRLQIEAFEATEDDVETHIRGRNKRIKLGQVGIRCRHCSHLPVAMRQKGSVYYPATLLALYQSAQNMSALHLQCGLCAFAPHAVKRQFVALMPTRAFSSGAGRPYWAQAAKKIGLIDTDGGIRFPKEGSTGTQVADNIDSKSSPP